METTTSHDVPVIDLFAGPGGLNEGFSSYKSEDGQNRFTTLTSVEMESSAVNTLKLRALFRNFKEDSEESNLYYSFLRGELSLNAFLAVDPVNKIFEETSKHVLQIEMGPENRDQTQAHISERLAEHNGNLPILIGGPPCQAYSLAGRSRRKHDLLFSEDKKHFLYQEYLATLGEFKPAIFVMENVKGLLSSNTTGESMFSKIITDLRHPCSGVNYNIYSLVSEVGLDELQPKDFVIKSELFGIPQKRHRVILLGIRSDLDNTNGMFSRLRPSREISVREAIGDLPPLRSGISPVSMDNDNDWQRVTDSLGQTVLSRGGLFVKAELSGSDSLFSEWVSDPNLGGVIQHETRAHMAADLKRYKYISRIAQLTKQSPTLKDLPQNLLPNHKSAIQAVRPFEDRFRVQVWDKPATTIVSHISKDGHYYIHPDPNQSRSLTVREAARLQTFPDNYFFCGNRTQQFHQVGNAVPPLLAAQIAEVVDEIYKAIVKV